MTTSREFGPVRVERDDHGVATLRFDRPAAYNALDTAAAQGFRAACDALAEAPPRAIVICGAGKAFGVGGDLAAMRSDADAVSAQLIDGLHGGIRVLAQLDAPVVGSLQGAVAGGSMSLALSCDLAIAADNASFNLAYARIGASCDGSSSWHLPRLVGLRKAMEIALLSESIDAAEALRLGLVNRVVPAATLQDETLALARRLAAGPTLAYGRMKRLLRQSWETDLSTQLDAEAKGFSESARTRDFAEGLEAFFGKRAARFEGR